MREIEYGLYFAQVQDQTSPTSARHHIAKGYHLDDLPRLARRAKAILEDFQGKAGTLYRLHKSWSTGMEIWESPYGVQEEFHSPDRRLAYLRWTDENLTIEPGVDPGLFEERA